MWAILAVAFGILIGYFIPYEFPFFYVRYISCAFLAALDSVLGAAKASIEGRFEFKLFITGFIANTLLAGLLTFIGDRLGVELYLAAVLTFGVRIFNNLTFIRIDLINRKKEE